MLTQPSVVRTASITKRFARGVDHIAIAVADLEASIDWFTNVLGFSLKERRKTEGSSTGMISAVLEAGPLNFVLLQGTSPQSQVSRYIEHYGPGVQHIAILVADIDALVCELTSAGFEFDTTIINGGGLRQIFSKRDQRSGLMFEFIERSEAGFVDGNVASLFSQLENKGSF